MASERATDAAHFKDIPMTAEQYASLLLIEILDDGDAARKEPTMLSWVTDAIAAAEKRGAESAQKRITELEAELKNAWDVYEANHG